MKIKRIILQKELLFSGFIKMSRGEWLDEWMVKEKKSFTIKSISQPPNTKTILEFNHLYMSVSVCMRVCECNF